jgi:hypothetical protein
LSQRTKVAIMCLRSWLWLMCVIAFLLNMELAYVRNSFFVEYGARVASDFDDGHQCFGGNEAYIIASGLHGLRLCDIMTQGLIGLIEYSYHQDIPSFSEAHLQRTLGFSVLGSKQF